MFPNMMTAAKKLGRKRQTRTNPLGAKLLESARQALHAANTGDMTGVTIREVTISQPGGYGPTEVKALWRSNPGDSPSNSAIPRSRGGR
jgi:hypothetical protein